MVPITDCFSNRYDFAKPLPIRKELLGERPLLAGSPRAHRPRPVAKARLEFLVIRIVRGPASSGSAILTGQAQSCITFGALSIGSLGTTITGAFWVEPWLTNRFSGSDC